VVFKDRSLTCAECGQTFTFSADDQRYHLEKGYTEPKRCPTCRQSRRAQSGRGGGMEGAARQMHPAVCAQCGADTEVPFLPRTDRPVYCNDCYRERRQTGAL